MDLKQLGPTVMLTNALLSNATKPEKAKPGRPGTAVAKIDSANITKKVFQETER